MRFFCILNVHKLFNLYTFSSFLKHQDLISILIFLSKYDQLLICKNHNIKKLIKIPQLIFFLVSLAYMILTL